MSGAQLSRRLMVAGGLAGFSFADPLSRALAQEAAEATAVIPGTRPADESAEVDLMTMTDRQQRLTAPVMINGQGPFDFMLDTGANRSAIATTLANRLGLPRGRPMTVYTTVGPIQTASVSLNTLQVGDRVMRRTTAPVLSAAGLRADGVLGVDWLKGERLVLDMINERMEIRRPGRTQMTAETVVPARLRSGQLTIIDAELNGRGRINAMIDSGSEVTMGNSHLRTLAALRNPGFERELRPIGMIDASNRSFEGMLGYLPFVRIGGVQFGNLPVVFADTPILKLWNLHTEPSVLLGIDVLRQFERVELDFSQSRVGFTVLGPKPV